MRSRLSGLFDHLTPENELMTSQTFNMFTFQKHLILECARMDLKLVLLVSGFRIGSQFMPRNDETYPSQNLDWFTLPDHYRTMSDFILFRQLISTTNFDRKT